MKVKAILWKYKKLKDDSYPIKFRITETIDGVTRQRYHPLNAYATVAQWDYGTRRVKSGHPNAYAINLKIIQLELDLQNQVINGEEVSFKKSASKKIVDYYESLLVGMKTKHSAGYYNMHKSIKEKFKLYSPNMTFDKLKLSDIKGFETHLLKMDNGRTTTHNNLKRLKYVVQEAVKEGLLEYHKNPFIHVKLESSKTKKSRISYEKIQELEKLELKKDSGIWHTRNYWLFSFYCAGIRFGDLCRMNKANLVTVNKQKRLIYTMNKTSKNRNILLIDRAVDILKLYTKSHKELLFGIITHVPKDKFKELAIIASQNTIANNNLKKLEKLVKSDVKLTFHSSRHSFADYAKQSGLDLYTIKNLLGHDKINTTEIYMQNFYEEQTDEAINKMFGK